jgi:hypothetical protein
MDSAGEGNKSESSRALDRLTMWHRLNPALVAAALNRFSELERAQLALTCYDGPHRDLARTVLKTVAAHSSVRSATRSPVARCKPVRGVFDHSEMRFDRHGHEVE